jgi:transposase InsO family protein
MIDSPTCSTLGIAGRGIGKAMADKRQGRGLRHAAQARALPEKDSAVWLAPPLATTSTDFGHEQSAVRRVDVRDHMRAELTIAALVMAIRRQKPPPSLIHHCDSQYAAAGYRKVLSAAGMIQSMSRKGNCWDYPDGKLLRHSEN